MSELDTWRPDIEGWSSDILPFYRDVVVPRLLAGGIFVEVGVHYGRSLLFLADQLAIAGARPTLFGVDPHRWDADQFPRFITNLMTLTRSAIGLVHPLRLPSLQAALLFENVPLDVVFIDGEHDFESVRDDIAAWWPKIRSGGLLCGHDYGSHAPGVVRACEHHFAVNFKTRESVWMREVE